MTLRIGIVGAARVATYALIDAARDVDGVSAHAIAARDPERARSYAADHGITVTYPDYQALIDASDVDAVYVALPPALHARWSIAAAEAGKPVLCEKPFALSVADVEAMIDAEARTSTLIMEAQHTRYHPICIRARELIADGAIGRVRHISGTFTADIPYSPDEIRWNGAVGGGALWDLGVYPAYWLRHFMGEEPVVEAARHQLADSGADIQSWAALRFPSGATGEITADMVNPTMAAWVKVEGARGEMLVMNPLSNSHPRSITVTTAAGSVKEMVGGRTSFALQLEAFRDAVLNGAMVSTRGADSLATIRLLAAIRAKAEES